MSNSDQLLAKVASRQRLTLHGRWMQRICRVLAGVVALLLMTGWLFNLAAPSVARMVIVLLPPAAMLASCAMVRRVEPTQAARLIDRHLATKDLFLTAAVLKPTAGGYQPLVAARASKIAGSVAPAKVVPLDWAVPTCRTGVILLVLLAATFLPTLDLAGHGTRDELVDLHRRQLAEQKKKAAQRTAALQAIALADPNAADVRNTLTKLADAFKRMRPEMPKINREQLQVQQEELDAKWKRANKQLPPRQGTTYLNLPFGGASQFFKDAWKTGMATGRPDDLIKAMQNLRDRARKMARETDPARRNVMRTEIQQRLQALADLAASERSTPGLEDGLKQAVQQMELSALDGLAPEAMEAFDQSMVLSQLELQAMAQALRDIAALEEAMDALQAARQLNQIKPLNGAAYPECQTMSEFATRYQLLMQKEAGKPVACSICNGAGKQPGDDATCKGCQGRGELVGIVPGQGNGPGIATTERGQGKFTPEDDTLKTGFKTQRSPSHLRAGEILMSWKIQKRWSDGKVEFDYANALQDLKQGYSEAILQERIPPEHRASIRRYFDTLPGPTASDQGGPSP